MKNEPYSWKFGLDYCKEPEMYKVGKGEQSVSTRNGTWANLLGGLTLFLLTITAVALIYFQFS